MYMHLTPDEIIGGWRWAGHVTHMREKNAYIECWWENQKKRHY
jgi:hypothetical protein